DRPPRLGQPERADSVRRAAERRQRSEPRALVAEEDEGLLAALKAKRRALADAMGVPAYVVFPDRTLIEMATARPQDLDALSRVSGVGAVKLERFGPEFLAVLTGAPPEPMPPARRRIAGQAEAEVFDRLLAAQVALSRGADGLGKPLNCTHTTLAKIAELRPRTLAELAGVVGVGPLKVERFGEAFLAILREAS
ncbi:MAG TPA: HRDC domain-containing protein, partial [Amaricoccus sp.]|nr:HRDC domain-containing protein [Amaricoccus sp.]